MCFNRQFHIGYHYWFTKNVLKSISEARGYPDGQFLAISFHFRPFLATYLVQDGPDCASIVHFILGINVALSFFVLKSISEAGGAPDGQVLAVPGPHVVREGRHQNVN